MLNSTAMSGLVAWMYRDLFRWLQTAVSASVWIGFPILLVMFFFRRLRGWVGIILLYISYLTGFTCWVFSFITTYYTLGGIWLVIGLLFVGVGVFPMALFGTIRRGLWSNLLDLLLAIVLMVVPRLVGLWIVDRHSAEI